MARTKGGINLLNLTAQNQVYIDLTPKCLAWAFIANALISNIMPSEVSDHEQVNTFLQTWDILTQGPCASKLSFYIMSLLKTVKKYHIDFTTLKLFKDLKSQMTSWYHIGLNLVNYKKRKS